MNKRQERNICTSTTSQGLSEEIRFKEELCRFSVVDCWTVLCSISGGKGEAEMSLCVSGGSSVLFLIHTDIFCGHKHRCFDCSWTWIWTSSGLLLDLRGAHGTAAELHVRRLDREVTHLFCFRDKCARWCSNVCTLIWWWVV